MSKGIDPTANEAFTAEVREGYGDARDDLQAEDPVALALELSRSIGERFLTLSMRQEYQAADTRVPDAYN